MAPVISLHGNSTITHEAGTAYLDANASWSDAVDGSGVIVASGEVNASTPGTYTLTYTYTDAAGNVAQTVTRTVHVVDTTAPVISLHGESNITHEAGTAYLDANGSWSDAVDGSGVIVASGEVNASESGTYVLSYIYTDAAGNSAQAVTRTVHVVDTTAPIISLNGDGNITHEAGTAYLDANGSWSDAVDGSGVIVASWEVNASEPGTYVLSYNYTDTAGNVAQTVTRTVHVVDTTAPVISLHGDSNITHEAGTAYFDANASWSDAVDGSGVVYASGEVNVSDPGVYVLSYDYTDAAGNVAQTVPRTVHVVDTTAPVISLHDDSNITHEAGNPYFDLNASWSDAVDGSGVIVASGEVNASAPGTYVISYNYTDTAGNVAQTVTRTVHVVDTIAPVINLHGDAKITHEAGNPYVDANASWSDAVDGTGIIVTSGEVNGSNPGTYLLSYNFIDTAGNAAEEITREVEVVNLSPVDLFILDDRNLSIQENEPNGTVVGVFQGVDPNPDCVLTYSLIRMGEPNNYLDYNVTHSDTPLVSLPEYFHLDQNGTLTSKTSLDYESDPHEIPLLVRVTDQHDAFLEVLFSVSLLNVVEDFDADGLEDHYDQDDDGDDFNDSVEISNGFDPLNKWSHPDLPLVRTAKVFENNQTLVFGVEIMSSGGMEEMEAGILVFDDSGLLISEPTRDWNANTDSEINLSLNGFLKGEKIRYQAFARNIAGRSTGQMLEYLVGEDHSIGKWWADDIRVGGGWRESKWMGVYLANPENEWIYHSELGWLFVDLDQFGGLWMWMPDEKWLWTTKSVWPFLWSYSITGWIYPIYADGNRYFYDYTEGVIR
jgi:adenosyl cobinamide kinase/adenosyl cobinamide phosphate guanylyltransferase